MQTQCTRGLAVRLQCPIPQQHAQGGQCLPLTNSLVKQFNRTLQGLLGKVVNEQQDDWDLYIPYVLYAYCTSVHEATKDSPFYLMYSQEANGPTNVTTGIPVNALGTSTHQYQSELIMQLQHTWVLVGEAQGQMQEANH